jgi:hypothetical protein
MGACIHRMRTVLRSVLSPREKTCWSRSCVETPCVPSVNGRDWHSGKRIRAHPHRTCGGFIIALHASREGNLAVEERDFFWERGLEEHAAMEQDRALIGIDAGVCLRRLSAAIDASTPILIHHERLLSD